VGGGVGEVVEDHLGEKQAAGTTSRQPRAHSKQGSLRGGVILPSRPHLQCLAAVGVGRGGEGVGVGVGGIVEDHLREKQAAGTTSRKPRGNSKQGSLKGW
jgi:hypothetical protein